MESNKASRQACVVLASDSADRAANFLCVDIFEPCWDDFVRWANRSAPLFHSLDLECGHGHSCPEPVTEDERFRED